MEKRAEYYQKFKEGIYKIISLEKCENQGALKVLHSPDQARDSDLALERMKREIEAMGKNLHPNLIHIKDVDNDFGWYVSTFYPSGTLDNRLNIFKGDLLKVIKSIRPLVEGVAILHENGYIHRDIKPQNVFIDSNNNLILGDFGLVYYTNGNHNRLSKIFENVGSRDWQPPWTMGIRLDEVKPSFDVFSLGKLIWSMVSGLPILQLWYFKKDKFNVENMFPESDTTKYTNSLLEKCIVEEEGDCITDAKILLEELDSIKKSIELDSDKFEVNKDRSCRVCGIGNYKLMVDDNITETQNFGLNPSGSRKMMIFTCSHCGNVQLFSYKGNKPQSWQK